MNRTPLPSPREGSKAARSLLAKSEPVAVSAPARQVLRAFRWLDVRSLWTSRNDRLARLFPDPTNNLRRRWIDWLRETGRLDGQPSVVDFAARERVSFAVLGDPGEGDWSQEAVVRSLLAVQDDCDFLVICSDVVYPAGDVNEYVPKFYEPYEHWTKPIYGLPGNHDWYDELEGFMFHFCGVDAPPPHFGEAIRRPPLWRRPRPRGPQAETARTGRPGTRGGFQPAPYFVIDAGPLALVCIDTGILGGLDRAQGKWLADVSLELRKPKVLLTGKPLIVDGQYRPGVIESLDRTVDDIVRDPRHGYLAAIGGDIHNYQRYPVELGNRCIEYLVSGGGGAFMHATHRIAPVDLGGVSEAEFRCFPLRGDSLHFYARTVVDALVPLVALAAILPFAVLCLAAAVAILIALLLDSALTGVLVAAALSAAPLVAAVALWRNVDSSGAPRVLGLRGSRLTPEQASTWMAEETDERPVISEPTRLGPDQRELAEFVAPRLLHPTGVFHTFFSEIFDVDHPPQYKHFLKLDADPDNLRITCYAALGTEREGDAPYVEDWVEIALEPARAAITSVASQSTAA